jgi:hypothetical protein
VREIAVGEEAMPWMAIKLHIRAVRGLKDSDNGSIASFGEITMFAERANAITQMNAVRLLHYPTSSRSTYDKSSRTQQYARR